MATCSADSNFSPVLLYTLKQLRRLNLSLKKSFLCIETIYDGKDVFVWLPTSFGKISCFQVLPFMIDHKLVLVGIKKSCSVLIISPLVVVMMDQADICEAKSFWIPIVLNKCIACFAYIQSLHKLNSTILSQDLVYGLS